MSGNIYISVCDILLLFHSISISSFHVLIYDQSDLQRNYIPEQSLNIPATDARALPPTLALRHRPEIMEDMNYTLTYLDHEVKVRDNW